MANRRRTQRTSPAFNLAIAIAVLAFVGLVIYGIASYSGMLDPPERQQAKKSREGMVAVPKSLVPLNAFEKVRREDVFDRDMADDSFFWLPKSQVDDHPEWITKVEQVIGRVMARDKRAEFVFSEDDFLPEGSRTGLVGGVPEGKQGFFLEAEQIPGLRLFKKGDKFDLVASLPEESVTAQAEFGLMVGGIKAVGNKPVPVNGVRSLVQSGTMVALIDGKNMTTQGGLEFSPTDSRGRPITQATGEQVAIAIDPKEVLPLTQALGAKQEIYAVARSGQQLEAEASVDELAGLIPFPAAAMEIKALSRITASDLAEPTTGQMRQYYFKPAATSDRWISSVGDLLGRVVRNDIDAGYIFSEDDFLPPDSLIADVKAFERITAQQLVSPSASQFVGRTVRQDISAGQTLREGDLLPPNSIIQNLEAYARIEAAFMVNPTSEFVGRIVGRDIDAGKLINTDDLLPPDAILQQLKSYARIEAGFMVNPNSEFVGRIVGRDVDAGKLINEDDLLPPNAITQQLKAYSRIESGFMVNPNSEFVGRVVGRDIDAGKSISENDLLPPGASAGIAGGIPQGMLAISVSTSAIKGLSELSRGDRLDVLASTPFDLQKELGSQIQFSQGLASSLETKVVNRVVAADALVVARQAEKVTLAIFPQQVQGLTKSLALGTDLFSITKSGRGQTQLSIASPTQSQITSDADPLRNVSVTEFIIGGNRSSSAYLKPQNDQFRGGNGSGRR